MAYTEASLTTSSSQTQQGFQDMVSWLTNVVSSISMTPAPLATFSTSVRHGSVQMCTFFGRIRAPPLLRYCRQFLWSCLVRNARLIAGAYRKDSTLLRNSERIFQSDVTRGCSGLGRSFCDGSCYCPYANTECCCDVTFVTLGSHLTNWTHFRLKVGPFMHSV